MKKEILIFGIIFLFIGVGIQPAFANENISVNRTSSKNIEDCGCEENNRINSEIFDELTDIISNKETLFNRLTILKELNENGSIICDFLITIWFQYFIRMVILGIYSSLFPEWGIIYKIFEFRMYRIAEKMDTIASFLEYFECENPW